MAIYINIKITHKITGIYSNPQICSGEFLFKRLTLKEQYLASLRGEEEAFFSQHLVPKGDIPRTAKARGDLIHQQIKQDTF
jgi:hypothetical protein